MLTTQILLFMQKEQLKVIIKIPHNTTNNVLNKLIENNSPETNCEVL